MPYKDPELRKAHMRKWWANRPESQKVAHRNYNRVRMQSRPVGAAVASRKWKKANAERIRAYTRKWRQDNPVRYAAWRAQYLAQRRLDPSFKILENLRNRVRLALKRHAKALGTAAILGCSIPDLRFHLQNRFQPGMTWANYGPVWHVDHKRPCASFDLSDPAQQKACFHFSNLQPLFAGDNLRKGDKYVPVS